MCDFYNIRLYSNDTKISIIEAVENRTIQLALAEILFNSKIVSQFSLL